MIIGITGTLGAGKGAVVDILKKKGFKHYSVRNFLIEEIKKRNLPINRDTMVSVANQLREINSSSFIIEKLYEQAKNDKYAIIESIRTIGEAEKIKELGGILIAVDADPQKRYSRVLTRQSETDNISFEKFLEDEKREMYSANPNEQNLSQCRNMADFVINNDKTLDFLEKKVEEIIYKIQSIKTSEKKDLSQRDKDLEKKQEKNTKSTRPSWDEYFMKIAFVVAERSTCLRKSIGTLIVKNKRIISTGYLGAPKGMTDCTEKGCLRDELRIEVGKNHEICRGVHAEQNAIIDSAYKGISSNRGIMYCTHAPCMICAKMIINSGIKEIITCNDYPDQEAKKILEEAGIKLRKIPKPSKEIKFKD